MPYYGQGEERYHGYHEADQHCTLGEHDSFKNRLGTNEMTVLYTDE